jgi:gas vesicle protein
MSEKNSDLLKGLFVGGMIGMALGILFAPKSGKEMREDIIRKADELLFKTKEGYGEAINNLKDLETSAKEKAAQVESKVSEFAHQGAEAIQSNKNRFKKAIDAGLEAYREENNKRTV